MSKFAVRGLALSCMSDAATDGIVCTMICPWFCPTKILEPSTLFSLSGLPLTEASKVVDAMLYASTTTSSGDVLAVDAEGILRLAHPVMETNRANYYTAFRDRAECVLSIRANVRAGARIVLRARGWTDSQITGLGYAFTGLKYASVSALVAGAAVVVRRFV